MPKIPAGGFRMVLLYGAVCLILVFQAAGSRLLSFNERALPSPNLHRIPQSLGKWRSTSEGTLDANIVDYLKPTDYILRDYQSADGQPVNLFVAYFESLDKTYGPHAPRICLPGAGWLESSWKITSIPVSNHPQGIPVNQLTYEKDNQRILVLYWYQNDRSIWAQEFEAKLRLLPDLIRYRRSDVSLVRLIIPLRDFSADKELASGGEFTRLVFPSLEDRLGHS